MELLTGVGKVAGSVLTLVTKQVHKRGWARRSVRRAVRKAGASIPSTPLVKWTKLPGTIEGVWCKPGPPQRSAVQNADAFVATTSSEWAQTALDEREAVLESVLADLHHRILAELDPSIAIQIASARSAIDHGITQEMLRDQQDVTQQLPERVRQLPAHVRSAIEQRAAADAYGVWQVVRPVTAVDSDPTDLVSQWQSMPPSWLLELSPPAQLTAADIAWCYGARGLAEQLYLEAARRGEPRAVHFAARAALLALELDDVERAGATLAEFAHLDADELYRCVGSAVREEWPLLRSSLAVWHPSDAIERTLRFALMVRETLQGRSGGQDLRDGIDGAIAAGREEIRQPDASIGSRLKLAQLLLLRVKRGTSTTRVSDLSEARDQATEARDRLRQAHARSAEAVLVACDVCMTTPDYESMLKLADSKADERERADPRVRAYALVARTSLGEDVTGELDGSIPAFSAEIIRATIAERSGRDPRVHLLAARAAARDDSEKIIALAGLARAGSVVHEDLAEYAETYPALIAELEALQKLTGPDAEEGVAQLRAQAATSPTAVGALVDFLRRAGRNDEVAAALLDAADKFHNPDFRLDAAITLAEAGRTDQARREVERAISSTTGSWTGMRTARRLAADLAAHDGDLVASGDQLRQILVLNPSDGRTRWDFVKLLLHRSAFSDAWSLLRETGDPPDPITESDAVAWVQLFGEFADVDELVRGCLRLARQFPDSERVRAAALQTVMTADTAEGETSQDVLEQYRLELEAFTQQWPDSTWLRSVSAPDDPDELLSVLADWVRPSSEAQQARRNLSVQVACGEFPIGMFALLAQRSYAEIIILRGEDVLPARSFDPAENAASLDTARRTSGKRVAIDVSALSVLSLLSAEARSAVVGRFSTVTVDDALADVREARASIARGGDQLAWNDADERPLLRQADPARQAELLDRIRALLAAVEATSRFPAPRQDQDAHGARQSSWLRVLEYARAERIPLWTDDVVMRQVARAEGVESFSTRAALTSLRDLGVSGLPSAESFDRLLLEDRVGDLPLASMITAVLEVAEADGWSAGRVAHALRRPAQWLDPVGALAVLRALLPQIRAHAPESLPTWGYACVRGAALAHRDVPQVVSAVVTGIFGTIANTPGVHGTLAAQLVQATRTALRDVGFVASDAPDPIVEAIRMMYESMREVLPPNLAAQFVFGFAGALDDEEDRRTILRMVLTDLPPDAVQEVERDRMDGEAS